MTRVATLVVGHTWEGDPLPDAECARLTLRLGRKLEIEVDAPFHGDPAPRTIAGPTPRLWEYEVVELFLADAGDRYLEIELGPFGHHLGLLLHGERNVVRSMLPMEFSARRDASRWSGVARLDASLAPGFARGNAFAIHGVGARRRHLACTPTGGPAPDFHRVSGFAVLDWNPR